MKTLTSTRSALAILLAAIMVLTVTTVPLKHKIIEPASPDGGTLRYLNQLLSLIDQQSNIYASVIR